MFRSSVVLAFRRRTGAALHILACLILTGWGSASARIPEPPHLIRGVVTVNGAPRTWGTVTLSLSGSPDVIASCAVGALPGIPNGYLLVVPMDDAQDPPAPGSARQGDAGQLQLDGMAAATVTISGRGELQTADLDLAEPHAIALLSPPSALPDPVASAGSVWLDVLAADTLGHPVGYLWQASCPGADNGAFDQPLARSPAWTAPRVGGASSTVCVLTVVIADGPGLSIAPSLEVEVLPALTPEPEPEPEPGGVPVPRVSVAPDPAVCGAPIAFDGTGSTHDDPARRIVSYEWDFDYDGVSFDVESVGPAVTHGYGTRSGAVIAALRVTDDGAPPQRALATVEVHPGGLNRPPTAIAVLPGSIGAGNVLTLDGSASTDPDASCGDGIALWEWDLNGDGVFSDAAGPRPEVAWSTFESLICGGRCLEGQLYAVGLRVADARGSTGTAGGQVSVSLLLFADNFANGTVKGDPDWLVRAGAWSVLGAAKYYASSPIKGGLTVARAPALGALASGRLESRVALTKKFVKYPNGAVIFGYGGNARYRYVRLQLSKGIWKLVLGQAGAIGADRAGAKASKKLKRLRLGRWYRLWVDVYADGRVNVYFKTRGASPTLSYTFQAAAPGMVGYQAAKARAFFDDFAAWDRGVLP